jgi:ABC-type Mn2+/Zn2+ transport system permease subunit
MLEMLKHDFLRHALAAAMIAGASLSFVGVYVILRRIVFVEQQRWLSWERLVSAWRF